MPEAQPGLGRLGGIFGRGRSGGAATVSAGFKIDDSSLKKLNDQWAQLVRHVKDFNSELRKIDSRKLDALGRGMGGRGLGGFGGNHTLGNSVGTFTNPPKAGAPTPAGGGGGRGGRGGGGDDGSGEGPTRLGSMPRSAKIGAAAAGAIAGYGISHYNDMVDAERWAQTMAWGMSGSTANNMGQARHFLLGGNGQPGVSGFINTQDALAGARMIQSNLAYGIGSSPQSTQRGYYEAAGRMGNVLGSYQSGAQAAVGMYNTGTFYNLMSIGVQTMGPGGRPRSPEQIARDFLVAVYGRMPSEEEVAAGLQQGAPLRANMDAMGLDPMVQDWIAQYGMLSSKIQGQQVGGTNRGVQRMTDELSRTGGRSPEGKRAIGKSVYQTQMRKGQASAELEQELADSALPAMRIALEGATHALEMFTDTLTGTGMAGPAGIAVGGGAVLSQPISSAMNMAGGMGGFMLMNYLMGRRGGGGGGPGGGGGGPGGPGGGPGFIGGTRAFLNRIFGAPGTAGRFGLGGRLLGGGGLGLLGGQLAGGLSDTFGGPDWLGSGLRWGGTGAGIGAAVGGPAGAAIGGAIGGAVGIGKNLLFGGGGEHGGPGGIGVGAEEVDVLAGVLSGTSGATGNAPASTPAGSGSQDDTGRNSGDSAGNVNYSGATSRGKQALAWMRREHEDPSQSWLNLCLKDVRTALGVGGKYGDANSAYGATKKRHTGTPPPGVPVWWTNNRYGHVALSAGGGKVWSNDIKRKGMIDLVNISEITRRWGATYRGWSEDINGVDVWDPPKGGGGKRSGRAGKLTPQQIFKLARDAGFSRDHATLMVAIAGAESTFNAGLLNDTARTGDLSYGLWQINMLGDLGPERRRWLKLKDNEELFDPATNARAAWEISGHGKSFTPWSAYKSGAHKRYMEQARKAAASLPNYRQGAYEIHGDQVALIHHGEMVVPAEDARRVRAQVRKRQNAPVPAAAGRAIQVTLNMPIHMANGTTAAEAERIVNLVASRLERDARLLAVMGGD